MLMNNTSALGSQPVGGTLSDVPPAEDSSPSLRLLRAVEVLATGGPMTYEELRTRLDMSKTATWRLVATLREAGWVRLRQGGRLIELDHRLDDLFANAHYSDREFAGLMDVMSEMASLHPVHLDLFVLDTQGSLTIFDTTRRITSAVQPPDGSEEVPILCIQAAMSEAQLERHLAQLAATLEPEAVRSLRRAHERTRLRPVQGYFWGSDGRFLTVAVRGLMGTPAVLRISSRSGKPRKREFSAVFDQMQAKVAGVLETFGVPVSR